MSEFISGLAVSSLYSIPFACNCKQCFLINFGFWFLVFVWVFFFFQGGKLIFYYLYSRRGTKFACKQPHSGLSRKRSRLLKKKIKWSGCIFIFLKKIILVLEILCRGELLICLKNLLPVLH